MRRVASVGSLLLLLVFSIAGGEQSVNAASATPPPAGLEIDASQPGPEAPSATRTPSRNRRATADFRSSVLRTGILALALVIFAIGLRKSDLGLRGQRIRKWSLVLLALAAYGSYYQFFQTGHPHGFSTTDNFHYYVGSKYFEELGYYGLYECSITVLHERGVRVPGGPNPKVRELRSMELQPLEVIRMQGSKCRERFSPERWSTFSRDVGFFVEQWPPHIRNAIWSDHGYHPTPLWTSIGGQIAEWMPTDDPSDLYVLKRIDRIIIALTLLIITWAFGVEVGCLAAILWGTGHLWRYTWIGDAFLRHLWWTAIFLGLCAIRRGAMGWGGMGLTAGTALRLFPGAFGIGYLAGAISNALRGASQKYNLTRFFVGCVLALSVISLVIGTSVGLHALIGFAAKIGEFTALAATNKVGLSAWLGSLPAPVAPLAPILRATILVLFAFLFWRGLRDALPWEASALGFALIPFLTDPTNYYYSFFAMGVVLAHRRPIIGLILLATGLAWDLSGLLLYRTYAEFSVASAIAIVGASAATWAMGVVPARDSESTSTSPALKAEPGARTHDRAPR